MSNSDMIHTIVKKDIIINLIIIDRLLRR